MKPIASKFLNGSGTYKVPTGTDIYGKPSFGTAVDISRFLAEAPKKNSLSSLGEQADDQLVIYFDCKKSFPIGQVFIKGGVINYNSVDYTIRDAQLHPTPDKPHHWELRLT